MIKTLKSELKLRPTYDEMIGMIEAQGDPNRPSIENVIDRRATLFRNNQFGSQLDNIDFLGLKKQEEDRAKEDVRRAQLRQAGIQAGTSSGLVSVNSSDFSTPLENYAMDEEDDEYERANNEISRIRTVFEREIERQREAQQASASSARSDLDEAHRQSLPAGVEFHRMDTDDEDDGEKEAPMDIPKGIRGIRKDNDITDIPEEVKIGQPSKRIKGKQTPTTEIQPASSSSSSTARDIVVAGARAGVETLAKAGATALAKSFLPV